MFDWLTEGKGRLVVGGPLLRELAGSGNFLRWMKAAQRSGRVVRVADDDVDTESRQLQESAACRSNDTHVVALAKQSGSRLLFTNDIDLQRDFKNPKIINSPRGVIYTTRRGREASDVHRRMLARRNLCRSADNA